jgi:hypothetical protein
MAIEEDQIRNILKLTSTIESYTSHKYQDVLVLAGKLRECEDKSPDKPPFALNYLERYNINEPETSWIIRHIFSYTFDNRHPFFDSFATKFLKRIGFNPGWIEKPIIDKDHEYRRIDILVQEKQKYAVIIENKLKGAVFQPNQLARYIAIMREEGYADEQIFVIILPQSANVDLPESVWNLPENSECRDNDNMFRCDKEDFKPKPHCKKCDRLKERFKDRTLLIHKELSEWLYDSVEKNEINIPKEEFDKQYILRSAVLQFVDFLNSIYQTRINNKYKMEIQKNLKEELGLNGKSRLDQLSVVETKKQEVEELEQQLEELEQQLNDLQRAITKEYLDVISQETTQDHIKEGDGKEKNFYYNITFGKKVLEVAFFPYIYIDGKRHACHIACEKTLPKFVQNDLSKELSREFSIGIEEYDTSYVEALERFDRISKRLLEIQESRKLRIKRK